MPNWFFCSESCLDAVEKPKMQIPSASSGLNHQFCLIIANISNATVIRDDIIIAVMNNKQHNKALENACVSPRKCILGQPKISLQ